MEHLIHVHTEAKVLRSSNIAWCSLDLHFNIGLKINMLTSHKKYIILYIYENYIHVHSRRHNKYFKFLLNDMRGDIVWTTNYRSHR